jgi:hypothetical protein
MPNFIRRPSVDLYPGIVVDKDTELEYKNDKVEQELKGLLLHSITKTKGEGYESTHESFIHLKEGDILLFEDEGRGYIKPLDGFVTIAEAIEDLENIKDLG